MKLNISGEGVFICILHTLFIFNVELRFKLCLVILLDPHPTPN